MLNKKYIWPIFTLVVLIQLWVPSKMIWDREKVLSDGVEHKFETQPIDPHDPFRGKYLTLGFKESAVTVKNAEKFKSNEQIFAILKVDNKGVSHVSALSYKRPQTNESYIKTTIDYISRDKVFLDFPFNRFYMNEAKARPAEQTYNQAARNPKIESYALVNIKDGQVVLKDVLIDGVPIAKAIIANEK